MRRLGCLFSVKIRKNADGATADGLRKHEMWFIRKSVG